MRGQPNIGRKKWMQKQSMFLYLMQQARQTIRQIWKTYHLSDKVSLHNLHQKPVLQGSEQCINEPLHCEHNCQESPIQVLAESQK